MSNKKNLDHQHLYYMDELDDYKVKSKDPDIRGWAVKDVDNRVVGKVEDLLVNKEQERVVYLDVEVDKTIIEANHDPYSRSSQDEIHEFVNKEGENHIIVPIGLVKLNENQKFVYTDRLNHQTFAETKRMEKGSNIDRDYEVVVLESYNRDNNNREEPERRERNIANDDNFENRHRERNTEERNPERDFETRPQDTYPEDYKSEATIQREKDMDKAWRDGNREDYDRFLAENIQENNNNVGYSNADSFYSQKEFDNSHYRSGRRR